MLHPKTSLQIEMGGGYSRAAGGRWRGLKREERKCTECDSGEVENAEHFLMRCIGMEWRKGGVDGVNEDDSNRIGWG